LKLTDLYKKALLYVWIGILKKSATICFFPAGIQKFYYQLNWLKNVNFASREKQKAEKFFNYFFIISIRIPPIKYMSYLYLLVHQSNLQVFHLEDIFHMVHGFSKGLRQVAAGSCSGSWLGASPFLLFVFRLRSLRRNLRIVILLSCLFLSVSEL
jgi:hypothetical protein